MTTMSYESIIIAVCLRSKTDVTPKILSRNFVAQIYRDKFRKCDMVCRATF